MIDKIIYLQKELWWYAGGNLDPGCGLDYLRTSWEVDGYIGTALNN
jgi:hypothetical protein